MPYPTEITLVLNSPAVHYLFIYLETYHNLTLGQNQLLYAPLDGNFGYTNWEACVHISTLHDIWHQPPPQPKVVPIVNASDSGASGSNSHVSASAPASPLPSDNEDERDDEMSDA